MILWEKSIIWSTWGLDENKKHEKEEKFILGFEPKQKEKWTMKELCIDSGASDSVAPVDEFKVPIMETEASKNKMYLGFWHKLVIK